MSSQGVAPGCQAGRSSAAPVSSAATKKKAFDRGGSVWPPRSNAKDDRLGGALPPKLNLGAPSQHRNNLKKKSIFFLTLVARPLEVDLYAVVKHERTPIFVTKMMTSCPKIVVSRPAMFQSDVKASVL